MAVLTSEFIGKVYTEQNRPKRDLNQIFSATRTERLLNKFKGRGSFKIRNADKRTKERARSKKKEKKQVQKQIKTGLDEGVVLETRSGSLKSFEKLKLKKKRQKKNKKFREARKRKISKFGKSGGFSGSGNSEMSLIGERSIDHEDIVEHVECSSVFLNKICMITHKSCLQPNYFKKHGLLINWKRGKTELNGTSVRCTAHEKQDLEICCSDLKLESKFDAFIPCLASFGIVQGSDILVVESGYDLNEVQEKINSDNHFYRTSLPVNSTLGKLKIGYNLGGDLCKNEGVLPVYLEDNFQKNIVGITSAAKQCPVRNLEVISFWNNYSWINLVLGSFKKMDAIDIYSKIDKETEHEKSNSTNSKICETSVIKLVKNNTTGCEISSLYSKNYPQNYDNNQFCEFFVRAPVDFKIRYWFDVLDIEFEMKCRFDEVSVFDRNADVSNGGKKRSSYCGYLEGMRFGVEQFITGGNDLEVSFRTDEFVTGKGFMMGFDCVK